MAAAGRGRYEEGLTAWTLGGDLERIELRKAQQIIRLGDLYKGKKC